MARTLTIAAAPLPPETTGTLVIYVAEGAAPAGAAADIWARTGLDWDSTARVASFRGKQGQDLDVLNPPNLGVERLLVLGAGKSLESAAPVPSAWTDRGGSLAGKLMNRKVRAAAIVIDSADASPALIAEVAAGIKLRHYAFDRYKSKKTEDDSTPPDTDLSVSLHVREPAAVTTAIADRDAVATGTILARDLVNEPPNVLGTLEFAERAAALADLGVEVEILDEQQMRDLGMLSLLAVSAGSRRPPRLVILRWNGGGEGEAPLAFIGKGVVFDTGGISIKPAAGMEDMKGDMGGAAAVTGLMHALATRKAKVNAIGVLGLVENMPDGNATRPGDIVRAMSGTTIEIINTDAEGRLVLADALHYTRDRFKPCLMIDLATLTGAIMVALGADHAGLFSNDDALAEKLLSAGLVANEKLWRMPLGRFYDKMIESRFADIKNTGGRHAGSITAAQFLKRFVGDTPWAHLDIAGTAFGTNANEINTSWAPGFGVALLDRFVRDNYED